MRQVNYGTKVLNSLEQSDVEKLLSKNEGDRLVVPAEIDGMRVTGLSMRCFDSIAGIKEIIFPASIIYVSFIAITDCDVERIIFENDFDFINTDGLSTNHKLNYIEIKKSGRYHKTILGNLYTEGGKILKYACNNTIAEGTLHIGTNAFLNSRIESVVIPESVQEIGNNAFIRCKNLKSIQFQGQNLVKIGDRAFEGCENLEAVNIPSSVLQIGAQAFKSTGLKELTFEDRNERNQNLRIASRAFMGANIRNVDFSNIKNVVVCTESFRGARVAKLTLNGIVSIEAKAFKFCNIEEITLKSINLINLIDGFDALGLYTDELKKIIETYNKKGIEITHILHNNVWIEDRFW